MPYITQEQRDQLDPAIEDLAIELVKIKVNGLAVLPSAGMYNYIITRLLDTGYQNKLFPSYERMNTVVGILECVKQEYYRRVAVPYEEIKKNENGDVY